jgi:hypothetical protein
VSGWLRSRYYCNNTGGSCRYALGDVPFCAREFRRFEGRCRGRKADGCAAQLVAGDPQDLRPRLLIVGFLLIGAMTGLAWTAKQIYFPPPLEHVSFVTTETRTDDGVGLLELEVVRDADIERRIQVQYGFIDGTAKAGEDYQAAQNVLTFERGERHKSIELSVLPDRTLEKDARYFSLTLLNVVGKPRHVIRIAPHPVDQSQQLQAEQMVLSTSRIAADIATFMVKRRVLLDLVTAGGATQGEVVEYKRQLIEVQDNLSRAREGYEQSLRELQAQQATLVMRTMDRLVDDLAQKHFAQQSRALAITKTQFTEFVTKRSMDMDRWAGELEGAVPRIETGAPKTTT